MICIHCGEQVSDGAAFCGACGKSPRQSGENTPPTGIAPSQAASPRESVTDVPLISGNHFDTLAQGAHAIAWDWVIEKKAKSAIATGVFEMETLLRIGENGGKLFREDIIKSFEIVSSARALKELKTGRDKAITFGKTALFFVFLVIFGVFYKMDLPTPALVALGVAAVLTISLGRENKVWKKKHKSEIDRAALAEKQKLTEEDVRTLVSGTSFLDVKEVYLEQICHAMRVDALDFKADFGRARGGGSTWVGWGSGGAIAGGLALSAVSKMKAGAKNVVINQHIRFVELCAFYNNVAVYFNNNVLPGVAPPEKPIYKL
jgi:hypothetical protein